MTTTIRDAGEVWIVEDAWTLGTNSMIETVVLEKDSLFLLRSTSRFFGGIIRELEVRDGRIVGSIGMPDSPNPRQKISIDAPEPILAWGAGVPQVIAVLPLAGGYSTKISDIKFPDSVLSPELEVVGTATLQIPAGTFEAWRVMVDVAEPGRHALTVWVDVRSRQVLRYDGETQGPGPSWTVTLER